MSDEKMTHLVRMADGNVHVEHGERVVIRGDCVPWFDFNKEPFRNKSALGCVLTIAVEAFEHGLGPEQTIAVSSNDFLNLVLEGKQRAEAYPAFEYGTPDHPQVRVCTPLCNVTVLPSRKEDRK